MELAQNGPGEWLRQDVALIQYRPRETFSSFRLLYNVYCFCCTMSIALYLLLLVVCCFIRGPSAYLRTQICHVSFVWYPARVMVQSYLLFGDLLTIF